MSYDTFCSREFTRADDEADIIARATNKGWYYKEGVLSNRPFDIYPEYDIPPPEDEEQWFVGITGIEYEYKTGEPESSSWLWMRGDFDPHNLDPGALGYVLDAYIAESITVPEEEEGPVFKTNREAAAG